MLFLWGGVDGKETLTSALIREAAEEINIHLKSDDLKMCHVMHSFHSMPEGLSFEQMDVYFVATIYEGTITNLEPHKCDELRFYPLNALPSNTMPFIRHAIDCMVNNQLFSEFGWEHNQQN